MVEGPGRRKDGGGKESKAGGILHITKNPRPEQKSQKKHGKMKWTA